MMLYRRLALALLGAFVILGTTPASADDDNTITTILSYAVDMTISSRFARTHLQLEVGNERDDCTALAGFTFQLPINARVTEMTMTTDPGNCEKTGVVKEIFQAEQEFQQQVVQGKPAALLKAYDATQYGIQISLPPTGVAVIDIELEELLHRYRGQVEFQVPLYPGFAVPIEVLTLDIAIQEPQSGVARFGIERYYDNVDASLLNQLLQVVPSDVNRPVATARLQAFDVQPTPYGQDDPLPNLLRGYYDPGPLPPEGLLLSDPSDQCFVFLFNPDTLLASTGSLPRNIVFVIDVSGSMSGQKIDDAKAAFSAIISRLTSDDYFAVQTFSDSGVKERFGPYLATEDVKILGRQWVQALNTGGGTNLEGAYINGIWQVESMQMESMHGGNDETTFVPVVMVLTDGQPTAGETNPGRISRNVRDANNLGEINARIYGLAFGNDADYDLLSALSLQNGGRAVQIYEGYGDAITQMENFYDGELGVILMSDVQVSFDGIVDSQTQTQMPVFAAGAEMVTRARVFTGLAGASPVVYGATTTAYTVNGYNTWTAGVSTTSGLQLLPNNRNECIQSFAHQKIAELMLFRDAAMTLGSEVDDLYPQFALLNGNSGGTAVNRESGLFGGGRVRHRRRDQDLDVVTAVTSEALQLALEAEVVWPGLTAMVTEDSASCVQPPTDLPVCYDGDGDGDGTEDEAEEEGDAGRYVTGAPSMSSTMDSTGFGSMVLTDSNTMASTDIGSATSFPSATSVPNTPFINSNSNATSVPDPNNGQPSGGNATETAGYTGSADNGQPSVGGIPGVTPAPMASEGGDGSISYPDSSAPAEASHAFSTRMILTVSYCTLLLVVYM